MPRKEEEKEIKEGKSIPPAVWVAEVTLHFPRSENELGIAGGMPPKSAVREMLVNKGLTAEQIDEEMKKYEKLWFMKNMKIEGTEAPISTFHLAEMKVGEKIKLVPVIRGNQIITMLMEALNLWRIATNTREGKRAVTKKEVGELANALAADLMIVPFLIPFRKSKEGEIVTVDEVPVSTEFMQFQTARGERTGSKAAMVLKNVDVCFRIESRAGALEASFVEELLRLGEGIGLGSMRKRGYGRFAVKKFELLS